VISEPIQEKQQLSVCHVVSNDFTHIWFHLYIPRWLRWCITI